MTITAATADALDALALDIFNLNLVPNDPAHAGLGAHYDPAAYTGIRGPDAGIDARYYALIAPLMLAIDGRVMPQGFKYTLNITYALMGRPRHWYIQGLDEFEQGGMNVLPAASMNFRYSPGGLFGDWGSYGFFLAGACTASICKLWAQIVRMWLAGNYPLALTQPG